MHSCESIGSSSSTKDSESSQQSSLSSSSTSSSFCSSSSSSSYPNQYSNRTLSSSSSIVSNCESITPVGDYAVHSNNVFMNNKGNQYANHMMPNVTRQASTTSEMNSYNIQNLVAQAGPPSIAEMILHGISVCLQLVCFQSFAQFFLFFQRILKLFIIGSKRSKWPYMK